MRRATKSPAQASGGSNFRNTPHIAAFTLIELLVVVAIIAILATLLLPALARGTMAARATECRGNLRDMGLAFRFYLDEMNAYPDGSDMGVLMQNPAYGWLMFNDWKDYLGPYIGLGLDTGPAAYASLRKFRCPQLVWTGGQRVNGQYAYNAHGTASVTARVGLGLAAYTGAVGQPPRPTPEARVLAPAETIAAGDIQPQANDGFVWAPGVYDPASTNTSRWPGPIHNRNANAVFCDGHVETKRPTNWVAATDSARAAWNVDHLSHPETWARP